MPVRLKKLIGLFGILGFLSVYVAGVIMLGEHLPDHWLARLAFYGIAGIVWGFPLFPLISWMNRET